MGYRDRLEIIQRIQDLRGSKVITYINSDRKSFPPNFVPPGMSTQLSTEAQEFLYDQLRFIGKADAFDLFLYTRGGNVDSVWPLVSIFREYTEECFSVLVPFRAHSAGTLIALGSDNIVLTESAELSPVDPTTGNQFNPKEESGARRGISVEDVTSYIELAKDTTKVGLEEPQHILEVFKRLSEEVHPLALGNVNRVHTQIRQLVQWLLELRTPEKNDQEVNEDIVNQLTREFYTHTHAINREEAKRILGKDYVSDATEEEQELFWSLYQEYAEALKLHSTFCLGKSISENQVEQEVVFNGGFIESENQSLVFRAKCRLKFHSKLSPQIQIQVPAGQPLPLIPGLPVQVDTEVLEIGWQENEEGV